MNKAKNVERMTAYVKKVNVMVEKKKQNKKIRSGEVAKAASFTYQVICILNIFYGTVPNIQ